MKIFLKLKHWQIFLIWIFGVIQLAVFMKTDFWYVAFGIYFCLLFGWIYSIGKVLNENNSEIIKKLNIWSIIYLISIIPLGIRFHNMLSQSYERLNILIFIVSGIIGLVSIINIGIISAKSIKETEKQEKLNFGNYALEFFIVLYMIIGVWILQPRLNKLINSAESTTGKNVYKKYRKSLLTRWFRHFWKVDKFLNLTISQK